MRGTLRGFPSSLRSPPFRDQGWETASFPGLTALVDDEGLDGRSGPGEGAVPGREGGARAKPDARGNPARVLPIHAAPACKKGAGRLSYRLIRTPSWNWRGVPTRSGTLKVGLSRYFWTPFTVPAETTSFQFALDTYRFEEWARLKTWT